MSKVKVGQVFKDNDPRMGDRRFIVETVGERYAHLRNIRHSAVKTRIMLTRMHTDGKSRTSGFSLVAGPRPDPKEKGESWTARERAILGEDPSL
jgi:hypothetical protein